MTFTVGETSESILKHIFGTTEMAYAAKGAYLTILSSSPSGLKKGSELKTHEPEETEGGHSPLTVTSNYKRKLLETGASHGELTYSNATNKGKVENNKEYELITEITAGTFEAEYFAVTLEESKTAAGRIIAWGEITGKPVKLSSSTWPVKLTAKGLTVTLE